MGESDRESKKQDLTLCVCLNVNLDSYTEMVTVSP